MPYGDDPKANAKAAKAYAKASRPWYKKKRLMLPVALVVVIFIAIASNGGGGSDDTSGGSTTGSTTQDNGAKSSSADDPPANDDGTAPSNAFPKQNGDWRLDSLQAKDDGLGDFGAVGRITYTGDDADGGNNIFTVTLFAKDGTTIVATLQGSANSVKPGQTVTTQFISSDPFKPGKFDSSFQNDL